MIFILEIYCDKQYVEPFNQHNLYLFSWP